MSLKRRSPNWRVSVVWGGLRGRRKYIIWMWGGEKNPLSSQGPISEVHVVGSKHFVYKRLFFCFFSPSAPLSGTGNPGRVPRQLHNRVGVATLHKPRGLLTLHCATMRSEEGSFFWGTKEWFFTRPVRTAANNELSGPWYHVRFHTRQLHSGVEQKGSRRNICGEGTVCPGGCHAGWVWCVLLPVILGRLAGYCCFRTRQANLHN